MTLQERAAISLNNMGVCLLEKKCYAQAAETIRDALETMRSCLSIDGDGIGGEESHYCLSEKLDRATSRFIHPEPHKNAMMHVEIVSSENLSTWALEHIKRGPTSREVCAIRIENCGHELQASNPALETAILLHNLAVSNSLARPGSRKVIISLLAAAYKVLQSHRAECGGDCCIAMYGLLSLEVIIAGNLVAFLVEMNLAAQASAMYDEYAHLCAAMELMEALEECFQKGLDLAAAA